MENVLIVDALSRRTCKCFWLFVSEHYDRYRYRGSCKKPCHERDELLARINSA